MASTQLFFDILARDHASATFNKVGAAADQLGKRTDKASKSHQGFGKMVRWAGGMVSAYGVGTFLKNSLQEYAAAEAAQNSLSNAYQRFPKMQNATLASYRELNKQLMLKTQFDDDDAAAMQANLGRFGVTGREIQKLTPLVADLAQAQGTDMVTAGAAMGKAFLGNTRALKSLGINYTSTGNRAKDYRNIVELLNKKVGGESTKAADTTAVKMKQLSNQYGELKETVGAALVPAFSRLVEVAGPAITRFAGKVEDNLPEIEAAFEDVWEKAEQFGGALKTVWDGFQSIPPDVRNLLLALAGGTWALGKVKNSAFGSGLSSIFSGIKSITARIVTVVGKNVVGGGVAVGRDGKPGKPGRGGGGTAVGGIAGMLGMLIGVPALDGLGDPGSSAKGLRDFLDQLDRLKGAKELTSQIDEVVFRMRKLAEPSLYDRAESVAGSFAELLGAKNTSRNNAITQLTEFDTALTKFASKKGNLAIAKSAFEQIVTQGKAAGLTRSQIAELLPQFSKLTEEAGKAGKAVKGVPGKKKVDVSDDGTSDRTKGRIEKLKAEIERLRGKRVGVDEKGAAESKARIEKLKAEIARLHGKIVDVDTKGTKEAQTDVNELRVAIGNLKDKTVTVTYREFKAGQTKNAATGGYISGPGTGTSDSIPARLSNGEYVIQASSVRKYGVGFLNAVNSGRLQAFKKGGLGKPVKPAKLGPKPTDAQQKAYDKKLRQYERDLADWQAMQDAKRSLKASREERAFSAMDPFAATTYAEGQTNEAKAARRSAKTRADRARAIAKQEAAEARLDSSRQARAEAIRQAEDERTAAIEQANQREADAQRAVRDAIEQTAATYRSFASISTTSTEDAAAAAEKLTTAQEAVAEARKKFDLAGNDRDRAAAAQALADAERNVATAQAARNSAGLSSSSIRTNMAGKLTKLREFASMVRTLKANGLNAVTLADILQMGPDQGYDFAKALVDGGLGDINELQSQITAESASLGLVTAGVNNASAGAINAANNAAAGVTVTLDPAPVSLYLNGREIATALLEYNRQSGG